MVFLFHQVFIYSPYLNLAFLMFDDIILFLKVQTWEYRFIITVSLGILTAVLFRIIHRKIKILLFVLGICLEILVRLIHSHTIANISCANVAMQYLVPNVFGPQTWMAVKISKIMMNIGILSEKIPWTLLINYILHVGILESAACLSEVLVD